MLHPLALILAAASPVAIQPLDADRFRLTILYKGDSLAAHANAQFKLIAAARRLCEGRGRPVSAGTLEVNTVPRSDKAARKRGHLSLSEEWRCIPQAQ